MICQGCGQEFTPMPGHDGKNLCPKCFINKLNGLTVNSNPGNDPAKNKNMTDQPTDSQKPEPTAPGVAPEPPVSPTSGEEPVTPPAEEEPAETPAPGAPAPEEKEEKPGDESEEAPVPPVS